jgi:hypothetical protein
MRVGVSPAAAPAAVVRRRRDNRPMATRSLEAVSMSWAVAAGDIVPFEILACWQALC